MSHNLTKITCDPTTVNTGAAIALNATPLLGSASRTCRYSIPVLPLTTTIKIQTAPRYDSATNAAPASGSALWTDLLTLTSASEQEGEITPDYYVRYKTTVNHAADPNVLVYLQGSK